MAAPTAGGRAVPHVSAFRFLPALRQLLLVCSLFLSVPMASKAAFIPKASVLQTAPIDPMLRPPDSPPEPADGVKKSSQARTNGWAVVSLICGLVSCIPPAGLVFGPLAVLFGILALDARKRRKNRGIGLAIAGMVLGAIGFTAVFLLIRPL